MSPPLASAAVDLALLRHEPASGLEADWGREERVLLGSGQDLGQAKARGVRGRGLGLAAEGGGESGVWSPFAEVRPYRLEATEGRPCQVGVGAAYRCPC